MFAKEKKWEEKVCVFKSSFPTKLDVGYQFTNQAPFPSQSCWVTLLGNSSFWECNPFPDKRERIAIRTIKMLLTLIGTELLGRSHKVSYLESLVITIVFPIILVTLR